MLTLLRVVVDMIAGGYTDLTSSKTYQFSVFSIVEVEEEEEK